MVPFAFELKHRVDDVFEDSRACKTAVFGDVTDEDDRNVARLGFSDESMRAAAYLHDTSRS